jgi:predicted unusual protein kinase regulating ubiquinone biosynthesis (AarF/ABC1/UbiB family)
MLSHRNDVKIPTVIWEHTTPRVLCMEFIDGIKITETERLEQAGIDSDALVRRLVEVWCEQILQHGFFHADPHPGNLMVEPESGRLVLLDFGLTKQLPAHFRESILAFAAGLIRGDAEAMVSGFVALGFETRDGSHDGLLEVARFALEFAQKVRERAWVEERMFARWNDELAEEIRRNPIVRVPGHVMLLGRVLGLLSGVSRSLGSKVDLLPVVMPYVFQPSQPPHPAGSSRARGAAGGPPS